MRKYVRVKELTDKKIFQLNLKETLRIFLRLLGKVLKKFCGMSKEILMKFSKSGSCTKFIEKQCTFFVQLVDWSNFNEF